MSAFNTQLLEWIHLLGPWTYGVTFLVIFCETGLIVTPFLPGDSLLFAFGAFAANPATGLSLPALVAVLSVAGILGNSVNYFLGRLFGDWILRSNLRWRVVKPEYLDQAHEFFNRHGGKSVVLARFIPILRTFAPFTAGLGQMRRRDFLLYNFVGSVAWVGSLLGLGYCFGDLPGVQRHFHFVILGIIVISVLPALFSVIREKYRQA
jgi:membrane-associated protein